MIKSEINDGTAKDNEGFIDLFARFKQTDNEDERCEIVEDIEHQFALARDNGVDIKDYYRTFVELLEEDGEKAFEQFTRKTGITREDLRLTLSRLTDKSTDQSSDSD